jgi:hypothetical protein
MAAVFSSERAPYMKKQEIDRLQEELADLPSVATLTSKSKSY